MRLDSFRHKVAEKSALDALSGTRGMIVIILKEGILMLSTLPASSRMKGFSMFCDQPLRLIKSKKTTMFPSGTKTKFKTQGA